MQHTKEGDIVKIIIEKELFQWEIDRTVNIIIEEGDVDITFVEFYSDKSKTSERFKYAGTPVAIPDYFLQDTKQLVVSACSDVGVVARKEFKVLFRKRPEDYQGDIAEGDRNVVDCVTEEQTQASVIQQSQNYVTEAVMKAYVKEYVEETLAAIPIAEEGAC